MTQENALIAYNHFKDLLENPKYAGHKKVWKNNIQHGMDSILIKHPEFKDISNDEKPIKSKGKK